MNISPIFSIIWQHRTTQIKGGKIFDIE